MSHSLPSAVCWLHVKSLKQKLGCLKKISYTSRLEEMTSNSHRRQEVHKQHIYQCESRGVVELIKLQVWLEKEGDRLTDEKQYIIESSIMSDKKYH